MATDKEVILTGALTGLVQSVDKILSSTGQSIFDLDLLDELTMALEEAKEALSMGPECEGGACTFKPGE